MTLAELLTTPIMRKAIVLAGERGLTREVNWCAQDSETLWDNIDMPGLLLLVVHYGQAEKSLVSLLDPMKEAYGAGVVIFDTYTTERKAMNAELSEAIAKYNERGIPLIKLPVSTNATMFMRRFPSVTSTYVSEAYRREEWLHEVCYGHVPAAGETLARLYGYNPDYDYYCVVLTMREADEVSAVVREMESKRVRGFIDKSFSSEEAQTLDYTSDHHIVCFVPWNRELGIQAFHQRMTSAAVDMRHLHPEHKWRIVVGNQARNLNQFHDSYVGALRTQEITAKLDVNEKVSFYDDWYMHMLLLKESRTELRERMRHTLAPILDSPDLLETLTNYLIYGEHLKETAEKSYIHVNTLKYRLKRIQELLGVDLKDPNARFRLRMAITIERYLRE